MEIGVAKYHAAISPHKTTGPEGGGCPGHSVSTFWPSPEASVAARSSCHGPRREAGRLGELSIFGQADSPARLGAAPSASPEGDGDTESGGVEALPWCNEGRVVALLLVSVAGIFLSVAATSVFSWAEI